MAIAVSSVLCVTMPSQAQTSTVSLYGSAAIEYGFVKPGGTFNSYDRLDVGNYDSFIGFRGEEKLGGGMSAWFQIESTFPTDGATGTWGNRNTAVGLRGGFGNVFFGLWDTPYKLSTGGRFRAKFGGNGLPGVASILHNETTGNSGNGTVTTPTGTFTDSAGHTVITTASTGNSTSFRRRQANSLNYHTPNWNGFTGMFAFSAKDETSGAVAGAPEPRLWSAGGTYERGPVYVAAGYEKHKDYRLAGGLPLSNEGWNINGAYTFGNIIRLSGIFERLEYEQAAGLETRRDAWGVFADWFIQGPHSLQFGFVEGRDSKGGGGAVNSIGRSIACGTAGSTVTTQTGATVCGADNGARKWMLQYAYDFSKRTQVYAGYTRLDNDAAGLYRLHNVQRVTGQDSSAFYTGIRHHF
jgi:predicted porin